MMAEEMILINTPNGQLYVTPGQYVQSLSSNENLGSVDTGQAAVAAAGAASASIAAGGATASALIAAGVSAQAIPVIGQILGGLALIGGYVLQARAKAKAIKEQGIQVDAANAELIKQNAELDDYIRQSNNQINAIHAELNKLGLSGVGDWLKKTFAPARYQQNILDDKLTQNNTLTALVQQKISVLEGMQKQLQALFEKMTGNKNLQRTLLIGGGLVVGATVLYFLNKKYKWVKL